MNVEKTQTCHNTRAESYKILADCYYKPDEQLLGKFRRAAASIGGPLSDLAKDVPGDDQLSSLTVDFSRLFVGPFKLQAYPYESAYLEGGQQSMINSPNDVEQLYRKEGLNIVLKEAHDHIAIELEFMYFLALKEIEVEKNGDTTLANDYAKKQLLFLQEHLAKWVPEFACNVLEHDKTGFYKNIAQITENFIENDLVSLGDRIQ